LVFPSLTYIQWLASSFYFPQLFYLLSLSPVSLSTYSSLQCSIPPSVTLPLIPFVLSHLHAFFSHACLHPPVHQSCARCHVAATVFAQRASASARRVGSAPRVTREHATLAAKNTASATMGPASASLAGKESTVTSVSRVLLRVGGAHL